MSSLKDKVINTGLSILIGGALVFLGADMVRMVKAEARSSLRERVHELVQYKHNGHYCTKIDGKEVHVGAPGYPMLPWSNMDKRLYVEVKSEEGNAYFQDDTEAWSVDNRFFGELDYWSGSKGF